MKSKVYRNQRLYILIYQFLLRRKTCTLSCHIETGPILSSGRSTSNRHLLYAQTGDRFQSFQIGLVGLPSFAGTGIAFPLGVQPSTNPPFILKPRKRAVTNKRATQSRGKQKSKASESCTALVQSGLPSADCLLSS